MSELKEETIKDKWFKIRELFEKRFNKTPDLSAILYVIGMRELGKHQEKFKKRGKSATHAHRYL